MGAFILSVYSEYSVVDRFRKGAKDGRWGISKTQESNHGTHGPHGMGPSFLSVYSEYSVVDRF